MCRRKDKTCQQRNEKCLFDALMYEKLTQDYAKPLENFELPLSPRTKFLEELSF